MYFGYGAPTRPPLGTAENIRTIAEKAEEIGLSYVSIADHISPPMKSRIPTPTRRTARRRGTIPAMCSNA